MKTENKLAGKFLTRLQCAYRIQLTELEKDVYLEKISAYAISEELWELALDQLIRDREVFPVLGIVLAYLDRVRASVVERVEWILVEKNGKKMAKRRADADFEEKLKEIEKGPKNPTPPP